MAVPGRREARADWCRRAAVRRAVHQRPCPPTPRWADRHRGRGSRAPRRRGLAGGGPRRDQRRVVGVHPVLGTDASYSPPAAEIGRVQRALTAQVVLLPL